MSRFLVFSNRVFLYECTHGSFSHAHALNRAQQLTRQLLVELESRLVEAEAERDRELRAEEAASKRLALAALPRKRSERIQAIELLREQQERDEEIERQRAAAARRSAMLRLSRYYFEYY